MALTKVSTDGVKDDAITSGKIPANAVGASELADNAVDTNAIANNAVTAGKTSGVQTTINNNADNRVITGSGTANTLEGESNFTYDGNTLSVTSGTGVQFPVNLRNDFTPNSFRSDLISTINVTSNNALRVGTVASSGGVTLQGNRANDSSAKVPLLLNPDGGDVGLGTTSPAAGSFHIHLTETPELNLMSTQHSQNNNCKLNFGVGQSASVSGNTGARIEMNIPNAGGAMNGELKFFTNSGDNLQERMRLLAGGGLTFNGDTAAANALDDYEEGTWTPDFRVHNYLNNANSFTYSSRVGQYTKIGRQVHITAYFRVTDFHTYTGNLYLFGLPFNPMSSHQPPILMVGDHANFSGDNQMGMFVIIEGGNSRGVVGHQTASGWSHMTRSEMKTGVGYISGSFYV